MSHITKSGMTKSGLAAICAMTLLAAPAFANGMSGGNAGDSVNSSLTRGFNNNSDTNAYGNSGNPTMSGAQSGQAGNGGSGPIGSSGQSMSPGQSSNTGQSSNRGQSSNTGMAQSGGIRQNEDMPQSLPQSQPQSQTVLQNQTQSTAPNSR
jgi:hypothetical protein